MRPFETVLHNPNSLSDLRVLAGISEELGSPLGFRTAQQARAEMEQLGPWDGARATMSALGETYAASDAELTLSSWKRLVDDGRMQDGDADYLATARPAVVLVSADVLARLGAEEGDEVTLAGPLGEVNLPVGIGDLAEGTVWAPASTPGLSVRHLVGPSGSPVSVSFAGGTK